jgi:hypothetical protein
MSNREEVKATVQDLKALMERDQPGAIPPAAALMQMATGYWLS